jgi:RNA-directed DNA polymerase
VTSIIREAANDAAFMQFFEKAIHVELSNMAELHRHVDNFPIEDIGVALGNSMTH